jgi:hypothetical protein
MSEAQVANWFSKLGVTPKNRRSRRQRSLLSTLTPEFLARYPDVHIQLRSSHLAIEPGQHFGSRYPGTPSEARIYDFIPDVLLDKVANLKEFLGALVLDKWTGNVDARQVIFSQPLTQRWPTVGWPAAALVFGEHDRSRLCLWWANVEVFPIPRCRASFQPWLDRVVHFPRASAGQRPSADSAQMDTARRGCAGMHCSRSC